ncbi:MAG: aromatic ring-hydroxylating dioxygenase subunit alpha [Pseudomonadota bacterium]
MISRAGLQAAIGPEYSADATRSHAAGGRYYTDPAIHDAELRYVFGREWNYFCHQSELPGTGDYVAGVVGGEDVFVIRGRDGVIRCFFNVCQHRGHILLQGKGGQRNVITCPYHAWSYDFTGGLRSAPKMNEVPGFDRSQVCLPEIRIEVIGGFIFINFDKHSEPLRQMAPEFEPILTAMVPSTEHLQMVKRVEFDINANWKIVTENFLEAYHVDYSGAAHRALGNLIDIATYDFNMSGRTIEYTAQGGAADIRPYDSNAHDDFSNSRGAPFHQVFLFPHMTFSVFPGTNMLFVYNMRPDGPDRCAEEIMYFTLDGSMTRPTETAEAYISDQLNPEDIALCEAVHRGLRSKGYRPGRLMVDADQRAGWGEQFVHHFNSLNIDALMRP